MSRSLTISAAVTLLSLAALAGCTSTPVAGPGSVPPIKGETGTPERNAPDGGRDYYKKFRYATFGADGSSFPLGVWFESVTGPEDVRKDKEAGVNLYVALTADSNLDVVRAGRMQAFLQAEEWAAKPEAMQSPAVAGWLLSDEIDMTQGHPKGLRSLQSILAGLPADQRLRYNNYGKGVMFRFDRAAAADFVNSQDIVSADAYWFTDSNLCTGGEGGRWLTGTDQDLSHDQCRLAANYGRTVRYLRSLVKPPGARPVWAFIEVGHPASEADWPTIEPDQVRAAVWSSIINGARGVVYFNHSFGGPAQTQHVLREAAYAKTRAAVSSVNRQIIDLAPALNSATITGMTRVEGNADVMVKFTRRYAFVFSAATKNAAKTVDISFPCMGDTRGSVVGENRDIPLVGGHLKDEFADGNAVHIYRLPLAKKCLTELSASKAG